MSYWRNIKSGFSVNVLGDFIKPIDPLFLDKSCEHVENCGSNKLKAIEYENLGIGHLRSSLREKKCN